MATPTFSAKLPDVTMQQLAELAAQFGTSKSQIVIQAVRQLHKQEIKTMNTQAATITVGKIDTQPVHDPYVNIEGIVSKTFLKLDPRDRTVWVTQEYNDNSTLADEWHGLVLTWGVNSHPSEVDMRNWIDDNMDSLINICAGYEVHWTGSNMTGRLTEDARSIVEAIEFEFDNDGGPRNYYETWDVESWVDNSLHEITADTTDEQLAALAEEWQPDRGTIVLGDILETITAHRDELKAEADDE